MTLDELRRTKVGQLSINAHLGGVEKPKRECNPGQTLDSRAPTEKGRTEGVGVCVTLISFRARKVDDDNLTAGFKCLRDTIARDLGVDDGDPRVRWECGQIETRGREGTIVRIEITTP